MDLRKSIEVGTFHLDPDDAPVKIVGDDASLFENSNLNMNQVRYIIGEVLIERGIYLHIGIESIESIVVQVYFMTQYINRFYELKYINLKLKYI